MTGQWKIGIAAGTLSLLVIGNLWSARANERKYAQKEEVARMIKEIVSGQTGYDEIGEMMVVEVRRGNLDHNNSCFFVRGEAVVACEDFSKFHAEFQKRFKEKAVKHPWLLNPAMNVTTFGETTHPGNEFAWPANMRPEATYPPTPGRTLVYIKIQSDLSPIDLADYLEWLS